MGICVLGLGYVGLTLAVTLAKVKPPIFGVEIDKDKAKKLSEGKSTLYEPGLEKLLRHVVNNGSFKVSGSLSSEIAKNVDTYIICIGTPVDDQTKKPVLRHLQDAISELVSFLKKGDLVLVRSTVTIGTTRNVIKRILEERMKLTLGKDFYLAFTPERTVEGSAIKELKELPQIIGAIDDESSNRAANIFNKITKTVIRMSSFETAEVVKLLDNTSRDVNIALANLFGLICESLGLQSKEIIEAANYAYPRNKILIAGAGVGGPCLVKDPYFLISSVGDSLDLPLLRIAREINDSMPFHMIQLIEEVFKEMTREIKGSKILLLGFAYKGSPPTDDLRYSPTLPVLDFLLKRAAVVMGYDPYVNPDKIREMGVTPISINDVNDVDCIVIMNNNKAYLEIDFERVKKHSKKPVGLVDGWQLLDPSSMKQLGYHYRGVGMS